MNRSHTCVVALLLLGCESAHASSEVAHSFVEALRYGDRVGLYAAHVESTDQSEWCRHEFKNLLAKARSEVEPEDCGELRAMSNADLVELPDELRLAVQVSRWTCENPAGSCRDYSRSVFEHALDGHPLVVNKPGGATIRRIVGDESHAAAYVDITTDSGVQHVTLQMKHVGSGWRVAGGFFP